MAEPVGMAFRIWTQVDLEHTIKPSMCSGDVALCKITLITYY